MNFFTQLMADAQPKADALISKTSEITNKVANSKAVQATNKAIYIAAVNTVGVAAVLSAPAVKKVSSFFNKRDDVKKSK